MAPGATPVRRRRLSQTPSQSQGKGQQGSAKEFCVELVGGELSQRLFGVVEKLNRKFPLVKGQEEEETIFPSLPGSHLHPTFPAVSKVKTVSCSPSASPYTVTISLDTPVAPGAGPGPCSGAPSQEDEEEPAQAHRGGRVRIGKV